MTQFIRVVTAANVVELINIAEISEIIQAPTPGETILILRTTQQIKVKADFAAFVRDLACIKF